MNKIKNILSLLAIVFLLAIIGCKKEDETESARDAAIQILTSKLWSVCSVIVPSGTATEENDWQFFTVKFSETDMVTSGYPTGSGAVWPSIAYMLSENGKTITRADGVVMQVLTLDQTTFNATFTVPPGTHIGSRIAALGGDYTFNLK
jgi:hypothetical protein